MTPGSSCVTQPALQPQSFLTRLHLSTRLLGVHNTAKKRPRTFHIPAPCLLGGGHVSTSHANPYYRFLPVMLQGQDASRSEEENLDFETLSPLRQPAHAAPRPDLSCLHLTLSRKAQSISPLAESSRLGSQGCACRQAQRKHWPCWRRVNTGYLRWVNRAERFNTPTVLKSQVIPSVRSQAVQRQSCVLTRHL